MFYWLVNIINWWCNILLCQTLSLQDQLRQRDSLVSMYQEQCIQLNEETAKYREQVDISKKIFHVRHYWHFVFHIIVGHCIHSVFCLTTGSKPPPKRFLHIVRSRASSFKWEYTLLSLRSSSSFLCLLSHLLFTSISPFIFPSITCFRRQFLCTDCKCYLQSVHKIIWKLLSKQY